MTDPDRTLRHHSRHTPHRTCVGCRGVKPKEQLIRLSLDNSGWIVVDSNKRVMGRGAYLCSATTCQEKALKGNKIEKALRTTVIRERQQRLAVILRDQEVGKCPQ
ncbi:MAG: YlxR family protein [Chloroflexota bacterium]|nr:YlxR family protein [Chloroflexota bacterium]